MAKKKPVSTIEFIAMLAFAVALATAAVLFIHMMEWEEPAFPFTVECSIGNHVTARIECEDDCDKWLAEFNKVFGSFAKCEILPDSYNICPSDAKLMVVGGGDE